MKKLKLICGLFISAMVMMTSCGGGSNERQIATAPDYIPFQANEDGNYGLLGKDGKVLFADEFANNISAAYGGIFVQNNENGLSLYKAQEKPVAIKGCEELFDAGVMQEGLMPITKKNERISFIDDDGKVKFTLNPYNGKEIVSVGFFSNGLAKFELEDGMEGYIDKKGKVVIEPKFNTVYDFQDGVAFVFDKDGKYLMIDKSGKTIKELKGITPFSKYHSGSNSLFPLYTTQWIDGKMLCYDDETERVVAIDKKGEIVKKYPNGIMVVEFIGDNYIYINKSEGTWGLNNSKDEEIIRPKYYKLQAIDGNTFLAEKSNREIVIINKDAEVIKELDDYKSAVYYNGVIYGLVGYSKYELLDTEGNLLSKDEYKISYLSSLWLPCEETCSSDYFNPEELAKKIASNIKDNGIGKFVVGAEFNVGEPDNYSANTSVIKITDFAKAGLDLNINARKGDITFVVKTGELPAVIYEHDETTYSSYKAFNSDAKISVVNLFTSINANQSRKENLNTAIQISKTIVAELKAKGWAPIAEGKYSCLLTKGNLCCTVVIDYSGEGVYCSLVDKAILDAEKIKQEDIKEIDDTIDRILNEE